MKATMKTRVPVIRKLPMGENLIISEGGTEVREREKERKERGAVSEVSIHPTTDAESADSESRLCCHLYKTPEHWNTSLWLRW